MDKKFITIGLIIIFLISIVIYLFFASTWSSSMKHSYLKHFDKKESGIYIDCEKDSDCKLINLISGCGEFTSINENNRNSEIKKYNNKEEKLLRNVDFDCMTPPKIEDYRPVCKNNQCGYEKK